MTGKVVNTVTEWALGNQTVPGECFPSLENRIAPRFGVMRAKAKLQVAKRQSQSTF